MDGGKQPYPRQRFGHPPPVNMQYNQAPFNPSPYPPQQSAAYPPATYPMQQNPIGRAEPPPPYYPSDPYAQQYPATGATGYPPTMPLTQSAAYPPQPTGYPPQPLAPYPAGVQVTGEYDPSARFGSGATHNVPPPPPGVLPNAAQVASMRGGAVQMQQRPAGWFEGHSSGGTTFW